MRTALPGRPHLTYCTNIHPGETLSEVSAVVRDGVARVKQHVSPSEPFGVGLRLSARAAEELAAPGALEAFRALLGDVGAYVFTINGFPYGAFHGTRVKEDVYLPDWSSDARVEYSDRLARILAELLPDDVSGSVSTVPGAFGPRATTDAERWAITERLVRHAATLFRLREETGKHIELALEPEPSSMLETAQETRRFFEKYVFSTRAADWLASLTGGGGGQAEGILRRHVGVCFDACHFAVEFEGARDAIEILSNAGIRIGKVQVTDALVARFTGNRSDDASLIGALEAFADDVYLHQVVEHRGGALARYVDLPHAIADARGSTRGPREWRIHFHVPVFLEHLGPFASTQPFLRELFDVLRETAVTEHLEVETYTWDVLPPEHRAGAVEDAIARELEFALGLASAARPRENVP